MNGTGQVLASVLDHGDRHLSAFAVEELQYILDGVRERCAGAAAEAVASELCRFQRVQQLDPVVVHRLAEVIASDRREPAIV
jgi:hypothetical protein